MAKDLSVGIDPVDRLVSIRYSALPSYDDWARAMAEAFDHPAFGPGYGFLFDCLAVADAPSTGDVRQMAEYIIDRQDRLRGCRFATVVASPAGYGMARMTGTLLSASGIQLAVFAELTDALAWLQPG